MDADRQARWRRQNERALEIALADSVERVRIQASLAEKVLGTLLIAHGGGIVGLLTFVGNLLGKRDAGLQLNITMLWLSFGLFALGIGLALIAYIYAFMSQDAYYRQAFEEAERITRAMIADAPDMDQSKERKHNQQGNRHYGFGLAFAIVSIVLFIAASFTALAGLLPRTM